MRSIRVLLGQKPQVLCQRLLATPLNKRLSSALPFPSSTAKLQMAPPALAKLKYLATKRGILENELIFEKFFATGWERLLSVEGAAAEVELFESFLQEYDWDIYAWITGQRVVPEPYRSSQMFSLLQESIRRGKQA